MTITARYAGTCKRCGGALAQGTQIEWTRAGGATHIGACPARAAAAPALTMNAQPIADFLAAARARGLRFPKARFLAPDGRSELKLVTAGERSRNPGAINVTLAGNWIGCILTDGSVRRLDAGIVAHLTTIASDPTRYAREYGQLTCSCSFCGLGLTDEGSVAAGYGPICAEHYGLPHVALGSPELRAIDAAPRTPRRRRASLSARLESIISRQRNAASRASEYAAIQAGGVDVDAADQDFTDADETFEDDKTGARA
jgi:hypothetical protein